MVAVEVNGRAYSSIAEAHRELSPPGLPQITVRWRLNNGWETEAAFLTPVIEPRFRRRGH